MRPCSFSRPTARGASHLLGTILVVGIVLTGAPVFRHAGSAQAAESKPTAELLQQAIERVGGKQGICVVLDDARCERTLPVARGTEWLFYLQFPDAAEAEAARKAADDAGLYGIRVFVECGPLSRLYLASNLADALVASGDASTVPESEVRRVLRPEGIALCGKKEFVKPPLEGADDWSHPYHGPDNNPASRDKVARGPYLTHFLADPRYAPLPQVAVASAGRVFKLFGHIAFKEREEPWLNTLAAFNGYNGAFLWRRDIAPGLMVHRNTLIATPTAVYFGDDTSCKVIDPASGQLIDEIVPPVEIAGDTFWKWMALDNGVLYALIGEQELADPVIRMRSDRHGWPWDPLSPGFNKEENPWGYGHNVLAIDPRSKKVLWRHRETEAIDSRAMCLAAGRLFIFRQGSFLACLECRTGRELWRKTTTNAPELTQAFGPALNRQDWRTNWRTTTYAKCTDKALFFSGPTVSKLIAMSAEDGRVLWQHPYNNYQTVLLDDGLYALSGQIDKEVSRRFDPLTGRVLDEVKLGRRACTRPTGALDAVFCRASGGSTRWPTDGAAPQLISPMRAQCQDGVTIANGLLYWWPSVCDCNLTLYGITCLGPAGDFDFAQTALESERLELSNAAAGGPADLPVAQGDWPVFRADCTGSATVDVQVPAATHRAWQHHSRAEIAITPPTTTGGLVFVAGSDGVVRALDAATGEQAWSAYTGGPIRHPPTIWQGRAFVGSGDGSVYAFEAKTGRMLWRFRAAPVERRIPVYGQLVSTWPAASGVLVRDGVAYVAAGIVNYDGTHVYALDAATGAIKWQNNSSGHLDPAAMAGVSVQGHMIIHDGKLWLAGGNAVSPAIYSLTDGKCLNDVAQVHRLADNNVPASESPRGSELYLVENNVMVSGQPFYAHPKFKVYDQSVFDKTWVASTGDKDILWTNNAKDSKVLCYERIQSQRAKRLLDAWGKMRLGGNEPLWETDCRDSTAVALGRNAIVVARGSVLIAFDLNNGRRLWAHVLPGVPVQWGLAFDHAGRVFASLEGGQVVCYAGTPMTASR